MKLTYRGVQYDYNPPVVETHSLESLGKYRGVDIRFRAVKKPLVYPLQVNLLYRGAPYTAGIDAPVEAPVAVPVPSLSDRFRNLAMNLERHRRHRDVSMANRLAEKMGLH